MKKTTPTTMLLTAAALLLAGLVTGPASAAELEVRGLLDAVLAGDDDVRHLNALRTGDAYTDPVHTRLFLEGGGERTRAFVQLVLSDTAYESARIFGAYLLHKPFESRELYLSGGKIPNTVGTWGTRTYADQNPLVGVPLAYFWQTSLPVTQMPVDLDQLVAMRGQGPTGLRYEDAGSLRGASGPGVQILYDNCWNDGVSVLGIEHGIEYELAATLAPPGAPVVGNDNNDDIALQARLGYSPTPEVIVRLSWARGAYLARGVEPFLAEGESVNDFHQQVLALGLELSRGYFVLHAEGFRSHYETPLRDDGLTAWSGYGELSWRFRPGWNAAVRYDLMRFEEIEAGGRRGPWDQDVSRWEAGLRYDVNRELQVKAVVQATDTGDGFTDENLLPMLQAVVEF